MAYNLLNLCTEHLDRGVVVTKDTDIIKDIGDLYNAVS